VRARQPGDTVPGYYIAVSCPRCGGELTHQASGTPGLDTRAVARCGPCKRHWCVVVQLVDVTDGVCVPKGGGRDHAAEYQRKRERREAAA
jgi:hypothetical protein